MLALSMVVISAMIGADGLGKTVYEGITQMNMAKGFEGGLAVVVLAMLLDRITQSLGVTKKKSGKILVKGILEKQSRKKKNAEWRKKNVEKNSWNYACTGVDGINSGRMWKF
jgi:hypothetical protein